MKQSLDGTQSVLRHPIGSTISKIIYWQPTLTSILGCLRFLFSEKSSQLVSSCINNIDYINLVCLFINPVVTVKVSN